MTRETFEEAEELYYQLEKVNEALSFFTFGTKYDIGITNGRNSVYTNCMDDTGCLADTIRELLEDRAREIELEIEKL